MSTEIAAIYIPAGISIILFLGGIAVSQGFEKRIDGNREDLKSLDDSVNAVLATQSEQLRSIEKDIAVLHETSGNTGTLRHNLQDKMNDLQRDIDSINSKSVSKDDVLELLDKIRNNAHKIEFNHQEMSFQVSKILEKYIGYKEDSTSLAASLNEVESELKKLSYQLDKDHDNFSSQIKNIVNQLDDLKKKDA